MAGKRGAERPTNPLALHREEGNVAGPTVRMDRQPGSPAGRAGRTRAGAERAATEFDATQCPPGGLPALPPPPLRGRVGLVSRRKRDLAEAQADHAIGSLLTLPLSTTATRARPQSRYRRFAEVAHIAGAHVTIMAPDTCLAPRTATPTVRSSRSAATPDGTTAHIIRRGVAAFRRDPPMRRWRRCRLHTRTSPPARQRPAARCAPRPTLRLARSASRR